MCTRLAFSVQPTVSILSAFVVVVVRVRLPCGEIHEIFSCTLIPLEQFSFPFVSLVLYVLGLRQVIVQVECKKGLSYGLCNTRNLTGARWERDSSYWI